MKKTIWKKAIAILMAVTITMSISGCVGKSDDTESMTYEAVDFSLEGIEGSPGTISVVNGKIYIETFEWGEDESVREGKILFNHGLLFLEDFLAAEEVIGEELNYIGYPNKDKQGSYFMLNGKVGMYAKSDVKDGAWEFIRTFKTKEYQGKTMESYCTPTRQDCFNLMLEGEMATKKYTNELGRKIRPREGERIYGGITLQAKPMTKEQADKYRSIVNNTKKSGQFAWTLMEIVDEEAQYYFAGNKSLDETVDIIQNRIHTYVNENR